MIKILQKIEEINNQRESIIIDPYNAIAAKCGIIELLKYIISPKKCKIIGSSIILDTDIWSIKTVK